MKQSEVEMKKTPLRKVSERQQKMIDVWQEVTRQRVEYLVNLHGKIMCEWCEDSKYNAFPFHGHHVNRDRSDNTFQNCRLLHDPCHLFLHDNNISMDEFKNKKEWEEE